MTTSVELTRELVNARQDRLNRRLLGFVTEPFEKTIAVLLCDNCGLAVDLLEQPFPDGWTTEGDQDRGWVDLCPRCS